MRECNLILPLAVDDKLRTYVEDKLIAQFGGFTLLVGVGAWKNPETGEIVREPVRSYMVAASLDADTSRFWYGLAGRIMIDGNQSTVYVKRGNGNAHILTHTQVALHELAGDAVRVGL